MFAELDVVKTNAWLPGEGVAAGAQGAIVDVFSRPDGAFLVEFSDAEGQVTATVVLKAGQMELVWRAPTLRQAA